jgi:uncharacterized protein
MNFITLRRTFGLIVAATVIATAGAAAGASRVDCPEARAPYSSHTALIDLLLDPAAAAELKRQGILDGIPPAVLATTPPSFAAIVSPAWVLDQPAFRPADAKVRLAALDRALAKIRVTHEASRRRCARYDRVPPSFGRPKSRPAILVFEKINGFRDAPSVAAAHKALTDMAARRGWSIAFTDNGAVFNARQLKMFDAVVWNNISGDALTTPQRAAFRRYVESGGGFAGIHGSGGDPIYWWDWYADTLVGARFIGHPDAPQFQSARVVVEQEGKGLAAGLPGAWTMTEEWYSFASSPRLKGAHVIARLDEATYKPGSNLTMGDHPIAWTRCLASGRSFYTAIGHRPASYTEPNSLRLLENGIAWAAGAGSTGCRAGKEVTR